MGVGLAIELVLLPHAMVEVEVLLPGDHPLKIQGEVRHAELLDNDPLPTRIGLVFGEITPQSREVLHRFVQARRTDRSEVMRKTY
jgi:hypothetical protein